MTDIVEGFLYIYYKDIKKPAQKKIIAYLSKHGVTNLDSIINNEMPVVVIGYTDTDDDTTKFDSMVS